MFVLCMGWRGDMRLDRQAGPEDLAGRSVLRVLNHNEIRANSCDV